MTSSINDINWEKGGTGGIINNKENIINVKNLLDSTGPGFCLAKFTQVTLHLGTGLVHSCHHPTTHKIPLEEIENNPAALFNTSHLKRMRKEMKEGVKPGECDYCWRVENNNGLSDRFFKSIEPWALENHDRIVNSDPESEFYPTYLEVDFSNVCNFKCMYCGPEYSTQWADELRRKGPVKVLEHTPNEQWVQGYQKNLDSLTYKNREFNPYVDAFWKWFPEAYKHLKVYRITGGEPLLSKETFKSMDWFIENPNPELEFNINTNLGVPDKLWNEFIEKITTISKNRCVKRFTVFTSVDAWGEKAEYLRTGLDFSLFKDRYEQLLQIGNVRVTTMCTFNILSITSIKQLLEWHLELKRKYNPDTGLVHFEKETGFNLANNDVSYTQRTIQSPDHYAIVGIDIPYLRHPQMLDAQFCLPSLVQDYLIPALNFMTENLANGTWGNHRGFESHEIDKFKRVCMDIMYRVNNDDEVMKVHRAKFYDFITEMDQRNNTNFLETFPEMKEFYNECVRMKNKLIVRG
jgi:organic radical activating enzyme